MMVYAVPIFLIALGLLILIPLFIGAIRAGWGKRLANKPKENLP